jgi:hypothetical protein
MIEPNSVSAFVSLLLAALVLRAYVPLFWGSQRRFLQYLFAGIGLVFVAVLVRAAIWDVYVTLHIGGVSPRSQAINTALNLLFCSASYLLLKARHELIPVRCRRRWSVLTAPFYPIETCLLVRGIQKMRRGK